MPAMRSGRNSLAASSHLRQDAVIDLSFSKEGAVGDRRTRRLELLEERRALSGVTLITHGFGGNVSSWVTQLANAMESRAPELDQLRYVVEVTDPGHDGGPLSVSSHSRSGPLPTSSETANPEITILLDWSDVAGSFSLSPYYRSTVDVADAVAQALATPGFLEDLTAPVVELPLHLIGHSRGGSLVGELARNLGSLGVWVDHVTTLDPHPVDGVRDPFGFDFGDAAMSAWETVVFWDNYWRTQGDTSLDFTGEPVVGSHDVQLSESVLDDFTGYANEHSDVHLWYHGTVDTTGPIDDGSESVSETAGWYEGHMGPRDGIGYHFSRVAGGARPTDGLAVGIGGGQGERVAILDRSLDRWPSLVALGVGTSSLVVGEPLIASYSWHDWDSDAALSIYLDSDSNPFNGVLQQLGETYELSQTAPDPLASASVAVPTLGVAPGTYYLVGEISDAVHSRSLYVPQPIELRSGLIVTSFTPTSSGFTADFSSTLDTQPLNLYGSGLGPADIVLHGESTGPVTGSAVVDGSRRRITFLRTGAPLMDDTYTVTLRSGDEAFKNVTGLLLDGDGDGTGGDDYSHTFAVSSGDAVVVGMADLVRGPGQSVNLPADTSAGIPITVSDGASVSTMELEIRYDPELLQIESATLGPQAPAGANVQLSEPTPGTVKLTFVSPVNVGPGSGVLASLVAAVPAASAGSIYGRQQLVDMEVVSLRDSNANSIAAVDDDAVHAVSYYADVSGNGRINAGDAALLGRVAALLETGFVSVSPLLDPTILGDISGNGRINANDASLVARFAALIPVPEIPEIPVGLTTADVQVTRSTTTADRGRGGSGGKLPPIVDMSWFSSERPDWRLADHPSPLLYVGRWWDEELFPGEWWISTDASASTPSLIP